AVPTTCRPVHVVPPLGSTVATIWLGSAICVGAWSQAAVTLPDPSTETVGWFATSCWSDKLWASPNVDPRPGLLAASVTPAPPTLWNCVHTTVARPSGATAGLTTEAFLSCGESVCPGPKVPPAGAVAAWTKLVVSDCTIQATAASPFGLIARFSPVTFVA